MNMVHVLTHAIFGDAVQPKTVAAFYRFMERSPFRFILPGFLKLFFTKQEEALRYCKGVIVPSQGMKRLLVRMYPNVRQDKIHVVPWGVQADVCDERLLRTRTEELRRHYAIGVGARVLMTLSRISPEKGQDLLLKALELWEKEATSTSPPLCVLMCGVAGYQHAVAFEKKIKEQARKLKKVRVIFPGYVYGLEKQAHFRLADLYVLPSRFDSCPLTLMEAFRAGLPAVATFTQGAEQLLRKAYGELLPPMAERKAPAYLKKVIGQMLADPEKLRSQGRKAQEFAEAHPYSETADILARLMMEPA
jgi:glycosyltransferase involved in cell wall biosynthesis